MEFSESSRRLDYLASDVLEQGEIKRPWQLLLNGVMHILGL